MTAPHPRPETATIAAIASGDGQPAAASPVRLPLRRNRLHALHDPVLELAPGLGRRQRERERRGGAIELARLLAAGGAPREVPIERLSRRRRAGRRARVR